MFIILHSCCESGICELLSWLVLTWGSLSGFLFKMLVMATGIWSLDPSWRIHFQGGLLAVWCWMLIGSLSPSPCIFLHKVSWVSSWHGSCLPLEYVIQDRKGSHFAFYHLILKVTLSVQHCLVGYTVSPLQRGKGHIKQWLVEGRLTGDYFRGWLPHTWGQGPHYFLVSLHHVSWPISESLL